MNAVAKPRAVDHWRDQHITLAHGAGGRAMRELIEEVIVPAFDNGLLAPLEDQARIAGSLLGHGESLAFTTDSFVVSPLRFPGGDIGRLAVCGTVNDLAVGGAVPKHLSCALILEEGLPVETLREVLASMARAAGIGAIPAGRDTGPRMVRPGDKLIVNGTLGDHGIAVMAARNDLALQIPVQSDAAPLNGLVEAMFAAAPGLRWLRDATRGGLATITNEFAREGRFGIVLDEAAIPVADAVRGACEILGFDILYLANEGKLAALVPAEEADGLLAAMRSHPLGRNAAVVGEVHAERPGLVTMRSRFGGERVVDLLLGEQLPRIC